MSDTGTRSYLPSDDPTASVEANTPRRPAVRFAAALGDEDEKTRGVRELLRSRLAVLSLVSFCAIGVFAVLLTPFHFEDRNWRYLIGTWVLVAMAGGYAALLWWWPYLSLRTLRGLELAGLLGLAGYITQDNCYRLFVERDIAVFHAQGKGVTVILHPYPFETDGRTRHMLIFRQDWMMWALSSFVLLPWVLLVVAYGLLVPNTAQRAAVITTCVALVPVGLLSAAALLDPDVGWRQRGILILSSTVIMAFAAAISIAGAYRVDRLRQQLATARQVGQYRLKEKLGAGGMGEVYRAEHAQLRRPCAVKLIRPDRAGDPLTLRRFEREVQATARLSNWHTVEIYDYGHADDGTFYYAMEYLPGFTLDELVRQWGPLPAGRAIRILRQMCVALREAHGIGLIHRDIKPGNIILGERGGTPDVAKLLDFGLVRSPDLSPDGERLTATNQLLGTPAFMSPEQAGDPDALTAATDIYSLGGVAYFLLTGRPPFTGMPLLKLVAAHIHEPVRPPREFRPDLPADLEAVLLRCLEKEPARRFRSAEELDRALGECLSAGTWDAAEATAWWRDRSAEATNS